MKKILTIISIIFALISMWVYASEPVCSSPHSSIDQHKSNIKSVLNALSSDISANTKVSTTTNYTLENLVLEVRGSISPVMGTAWWVSNVVFDHLITWGWSDFLESFIILFKPYPVPRDWMKLSLLKEEITQALLDVGFADLLNEPIELSKYDQKFKQMPVLMIWVQDYGDVVDAIWINQLAMEKIFISATDADIDKAKADVKNWISRTIVRKDKWRELAINHDYFTEMQDIHDYYKKSKTCLKSWEKFMESLKELKELSSTDYDEITTRFSDSYKRLKEALKLWNYDSDYKERKKQLIRDYMNRKEKCRRRGRRSATRTWISLFFLKFLNIPFLFKILEYPFSF